MALRNFLSQVSSRKNRLYSPLSSRLVLNRNCSKTMAVVVDYENLKDKVMNCGIILVDVREPKELVEDGKIPNSVNIPMGQLVESFKLSDSAFEQKYGITKPSLQSEPFVLSCKSGKRAADAFQKLQSIGLKNMLVYSGSFQDWVKNGGPVEK